MVIGALAFLFILPSAPLSPSLHDARPWQMRPTITVSNAADESRAYAKHLGEFQPAFIGRKDVDNIGFGERATIILASKISSLANHVGNVVGWRSKKQVVWVDALPDITVMANVHSSRDRAAIGEPRKSVSVSTRRLVATNRTITRDMDRANPYPATGNRNANDPRFDVRRRVFQETSRKVSEPVAAFWRGRGATLFPELQM